MFSTGRYICVKNVLNVGAGAANWQGRKQDFRARVEDTGPGFNVLAPMPKFELTKTIEAIKLNPRTLRQLTPQKHTIPYGAVLEKLTRDRDMQQFYYLGEPYECHYSDVETALRQLD
jgi:hypothetical protein